MTTNVKDRCRLCYARLRDSLLQPHPHKFCWSHRRIVNLYKARPHSYHDFIVRYLCINLPSKTLAEPYSHVICGSCADALEQLHSTFRAFEQIQKTLRTKFRKTSRILRQVKTKTSERPKRQSKRKGAPKHIDQHRQQMKKAQNALQLLGGRSTKQFDEPSVNSVKGNHIERIAVSLLSDGGNETNARPQATMNSTTYNNVATLLSPSMDEDDPSSNDSTTVSKGAVSSTICTTPTAEGLTITAINPTGQKQVFMAKQLGNMKKYQCGLCEKIVTNIQIHVRRHTNDKPYPCTYCEKRFTNSGDLQIHVRIHTGEKPYACPLCLKSYRTIGNFNSHVKTHDTGTRPHRCELCQQTFPIPKDWYSHLRSSHRSQHSETFVPNKMKLEPIHRSQLSIQSSSSDDQEPVNMSKKENLSEDEENEATRNLLSHGSSVHA